LRCPTCGRHITETDKAYTCDCVTIPKEILQQKITPEITKELISNRRTRVLDGFISKKNGKRFSASLVIRNNRVAFEFVNERPGRQEDVSKQTGKGDIVNIRIQSENSGTAHVTITGAMHKEFRVSYGHVSSRQAELLSCLTAINLVKHTKGAAGIELDISLNNLDFSRYILKERTPRDREIKSNLDYLFTMLAEFKKWTARYEPKRRSRLTGSPQTNNFPNGIFPDLYTEVAEENGRLRVILHGGPDVQAQFKASLQRVMYEGDKTYSLPVTARKALMAWINSVKREGGDT
jgi:hypothetical protein